MNITREEVIRVAGLARLDLDDKTVDRMCAQISEVLGYVAQLNRVDTQNVPPTSNTLSLTNAFREDERAAHLDRELALSNAPQANDGDFIVPKIIQE
ncbi:MAG: Asp-tRNA(Asn)/Glu-tRNA(Gln) amidotransferase GatCAB subunit C [Desulfobacterales bacterium CG07_land_8_20_14_0_80_52_14]|nr:MAG: Asp-tRNA(Asn)/Glu-tRNA(Gln) amidotransferase GatCAB subunit C [Desulfobacterales bacterium CG23_combo_of_CG06-09_8_20_14_all_52_9]PIU50306.1 MAG: Asp-tRNA(Asn)/Glu-tRNA(Gln) amidotransferase GatCAB subunit C [Desulfobacterales bacterium CG07_land_8_20_14_0_80_52_14]